MEVFAEPAICFGTMKTGNYWYLCCSELNFDVERATRVIIDASLAATSVGIKS